MVWILKLLAEHQSVQDRLHHELESTFTAALEDKRAPLLSEILDAKLPYLDAVLEETLRHRAAMIIPRDATRDTQLLGRHIPKATSVLFVCQGPDFAGQEQDREKYGVRRYPGETQASLDEFDPERWLVRGEDGEVVYDGHSYPQLAFGGGIRACWGRRLARMEMRLMTALVVWRFKLLQVPEELAGHEAIFDISFRADKGFLRLEGRQM